jgi:hypothetical protein
MNSKIARRKKTKTTNPPASHNKEWTSTDRKLLFELLEKGSSTKQVADTLGRTVPSVWSQKCQMLKEGILKSDKRFLSSRETYKGRKVSHPKGARRITSPLTNPTGHKETQPSFLESVLGTLKQYGLNATLEVKDGKLTTINLS